MSFLRQAILSLGLVLVTFVSIAESSVRILGECPEPTPITFAELSAPSNEEFVAKVKDLIALVNESGKEAKGYISVFGGRKSRINEFTDFADKIDRHLKVGNERDRKVFIRDGGYREKFSIVFQLIPHECTNYSFPLSDFEADVVELEEFPLTSTLTSSRSDFYARSKGDPAPMCPPAARAVRVCDEGTEVEVFIAVDENGNTVFARTIGGHVLLRPSAIVNAKNWKFEPVIQNGIAMKSRGTIVIRYSKGSDIVTN